MSVKTNIIYHVPVLFNFWTKQRAQINKKNKINKLFSVLKVIKLNLLKNKQV